MKKIVLITAIFLGVAGCSVGGYESQSSSEQSFNKTTNKTNSGLLFEIEFTPVSEIIQRVSSIPGS